MGLGDNLMATGLARGAAARGKRIAFGDGSRIIWDGNSPEIFRGNPNIAPAGSERDGNIEWVAFYKGERQYNSLGNGRWIWNYDFKIIPGELFFDDNEKRFAQSVKPGLILIEPNVPWWKPVAPNKDWGLAKYQAVTDYLLSQGHDVAQFSNGRDRLKGVRVIETKSFRHALAALSGAKLAILPEGGLHHGAAAVDVHAVVLFGGFIPPEVTGYPTHINLAANGEACGSLNACQHCKAAMEMIGVDEVIDAAESHLAKRAA